MKKLLVIGVALLCVALAAPAMAKVTVGGMIGVDMYYLGQSSERVTANGHVQNAAVTSDDFKEFNIVNNQTENRLIVRYANDEGNLTGYMELRGGGLDGGNTIDFKYSWFDYKLNDMVHFRFGRQPQAFSVYAATAAGMGFHDGFTLLANYGNYQVTDADSVKAYIKFNDMIRLEFQLEDPRGTNLATQIAGLAATDRSNAAIGITEQNTLPVIDVALPIDIANFHIEPSVIWQRWSLENKLGDDSVDAWGACLAAKAGFGPVTIMGEVTYGQNLGNGNNNFGGNAGPSFAGQARSIGRVRFLDQNGDGITEAYDADIWGAWLQFNFNFGPATLQLAVGREDVSSDGTSAVNDDVDVTRWGYAASLPIKVAKNFTVMPAVIYHDRGSDEKDGVNNPLTVDFGDEILVGVQFKLTF